MELSELSLRVEKLEEIIQQLAKWTNFNLCEKDPSINSENEEDAHKNENRRFPNVGKSARRKADDLENSDVLSSVVIKMELGENDDEQFCQPVYGYEELQIPETKTDVELEFSATNPDPFFIPFDGGENSESNFEGSPPEPPRKRRMSAKRKYEALKVPPKSSLPPSSPFVSLRPLTTSQILPHLQKKKEIPSEIKCPTRTRKFQTKTVFNKGACKSDARPFACPHCPYAAKEKKTLSRHIQSMHPAIEEPAHTFKCPKCPKSFRLKRYLSGHISYAHKNRDENFLCDSCPYVGKNRKQLQQHFSSRHKTPSFSCYFCPWMGRRSTKLTDHLRTHTGEKPYKCPHCIYTSAQANTLTQHVKNIHSDEELEGSFQNSKFPSEFQPQDAPPPTYLNRKDGPLYKCGICAFEGFTSSTFKAHPKEHRINGDKSFKCPHCPYAAVKTKTLKYHIRSKHPKEGEGFQGPFICAECPKTFGLRAGLLRHIACMHTNRERTFLCDYCPYLATNRNALQHHIKYKHKDPLITCYFCPWMGKHVANVANHMRIHTGEKPYKCPHCIYTTTRGQNLKKHVQYAHGMEEGSFQCEKCSCKFKNLSWLKRHQQLHDGSAYKCGICEFEAFNRDYLREHLKCHKTEDGKMFQCPHCQNTFKSRFVVQGHVRTHNNGEGPYNCEKCPSSFQEQSQLITHSSTCKTRRSDKDLKDNEGLPEQEERKLATAAGQQVENSEYLITMESILGI